MFDKLCLKLFIFDMLAMINGSLLYLVAKLLWEKIVLMSMFVKRDWLMCNDLDWHLTENKNVLLERQPASGEL